ncbi:MAG: hypothetical protein KBF88_09555 [Polyangiaceae bacterium]|nr:hypothetical protein [Polyangiaceae bacterium]
MNTKRLLSLAICLTAGVSFFSTGTGCTTLVTHSPAIQCESDDECVYGYGFKNTKCVANACVPQCGKNSDCAKGQLCHESACVSVANANCTEVGFPVPGVKPEKFEPGVVPDNAVVLGLIARLDRGDPAYTLDNTYSKAMRLFLQELGENKLPGGRTIYPVACSQTNPTASAKHLADLGAAAILGPSDDDRTFRAVGEVAIPRNVALIDGLVFQNTAKAVPGAKNLSWATSFQPSEAIAPLARYVAQREIQVKAAHAVDKIRVALVWGGGETDEFLAFRGLADGALVFNGKSAIEQEGADCGGPCYVRYNSQDVAFKAGEVDRMIAQKPNLIVVVAGPFDWGTLGVVNLEKKWPNGVPRPYYAQAFLKYEDTAFASLHDTVANGSDLFGYGGKPADQASLRTRAGGIRVIRDNSYEIFRSKFRSSYGIDPYYTTGRIYESTILATYALYAAAGKSATAPLNGLAVADNILAVSRGGEGATVISPIPQDIPKAVGLLLNQKPIKLNGLFSTFDWDEEVQNVRHGWETWCMRQNEYISTAAKFDFASKDFVGGDTSNCGK